MRTFSHAQTIAAPAGEKLALILVLLTLVLVPTRPEHSNC
jgi:hypothetical protein